MAEPLLTVGHGTLAAADFAGLLTGAGVRCLVDIRTAPGSRRMPHFNSKSMASWLEAAGIDYRWEKALGGWRRPREDSVNIALRNPSFRGYADYMETAEFTAALDRVLSEAGVSPSGRGLAVMCSETLWWRCHRRLLADAAVLLRRRKVRHLMHDGKLAEHRLTEGARLSEGPVVRYDAGQQFLGS
jgi:uncharacterized protein (DUF488 family)